VSASARPTTPTAPGTRGSSRVRGATTRLAPTSPGSRPTAGPASPTTSTGTRDAGPAAGAYERLAPYAERNIVNGRGAGGYGSAELPLGLLADVLGRRDDARAHLTRAVARNTAMGADWWVAAARRALDGLAA
jgi:hypothetical protein